MCLKRTHATQYTLKGYQISNENTPTNFFSLSLGERTRMHPGHSMKSMSVDGWVCIYNEETFLIINTEKK